jgi:DNA adenine methylase
MKSLKSLKTPLRYPGGKSKAIKTLSQWYPKVITEYREPFLGGGSIAIDVTKANPDIPIWVNDLYVPLYNFWVQLRDRGQDLSESVREQKEKMLESGTQDQKDQFARDLFDRYANEIDTYDDFQKAVAFFIMNKCSYSGLTENSTFSRTAANSNFSLVGADKLAQFSELIKNWKITNIDYSKVMNANGPENTFVFLDPPYDIKDFLYGKDKQMHKFFDHDVFAENVNNCPHKFMITYNDNERLRELYKDYYINEWKLRYSMVHRGDKNTQDNVKTELLVTNYDITGSDNSVILNLLLDL